LIMGMDVHLERLDLVVCDGRRVRHPPVLFVHKSITNSCFPALSH